MPQQLIDLSTGPGTGLGTDFRSGGAIINANFTELYALQSRTINAADNAYASGVGNEGKIQLAINDAAGTGAKRVYVPSSMLPYSAASITFIAGVQMVREGGRFDVYDVMAYGADPTGVADSTTSFQKALDAANTTGSLGVVLVPGGAYVILSTLNIYKYTTLQGSGWQTTTLGCNHTGDGVASTWPANSSTGAFVTIRDISIGSPNAGNVGSGFADLGGSYLRLENVYIDGFRDQISLDQSELVVIDKCYTNQSASRCRSGIWIVNGPDRVVGNSRMYSNGITIRDHEFNGTGNLTGVNFRDDGGRNHTLINCNFNGGGTAATLASVTGLTIINGASEGHVSRGLSFVRLASLSGVDGGPCQSVSVRNFSLNDPVGNPIILNAGQQGEIVGCWFSQATADCINVTGDEVFGWTIHSNWKSMAVGSEVGGKFLHAGTAQRYASQPMTQRGMSRVAASHAGGSQVVTPVVMGAAGTTEPPVVGSVLYCVNADGTNEELVTVTAATATTWTGTFATAKTANWQSSKVS